MPRYWLEVSAVIFSLVYAARDQPLPPLVFESIPGSERMER